MRRMLFRTIHDLELMLDRLCSEREVLPSAGIVYSQSVKAPGARTRGYDANKKLSGRKRHIAVDTDGRLLVMFKLKCCATRLNPQADAVIATT